MASPLRLLVAGVGTARARLAWTAVRDECELVEEALSRFRDSSEVTRLNRSAGSGRWLVASRRLRAALVAADRARRLTGGRFDARVLEDLDRLGYRGAPLRHRRSGPARDTGSRTVRRSGRFELALDAPVDLGGIGKGLALRWAATRVERLGVGAFLLEAGGDLVTRGRPPDARSWLVGIEDPGGGAPLGAIAGDPAGGAIATSSIRVHRWEHAGRAVHHLLDPETGAPVERGLAAVVVAASDPAWAEVWSKALFIAGADRIASEARERGLAAWWIDEAGFVSMTPRARARTAWLSEENGSAV